MKNRQTIIFLSALLAALALLCYLIARPFLGPSMFACLLAVGFYPLYRLMLKWVHRPGLAALLSTLLIYVVILFPMAFVATTVAGEVGDQFAKLRTASEFEGGIAPHLQIQLKKLASWVAPRVRMTEAEMVGQVTSRLDTAAQWIGKGFAVGVALAGSWIMNGVLAAIILFFLLRDGRAIRDAIVDFLPIKRTPKS